MYPFQMTWKPFSQQFALYWQHLKTGVFFVFSVLCAYVRVCVSWWVCLLRKQEMGCSHGVKAQSDSSQSFHCTIKGRASWHSFLRVPWQPVAATKILSSQCKTKEEKVFLTFSKGPFAFVIRKGATESLFMFHCGCSYGSFSFRRHTILAKQQCINIRRGYAWALEQNKKI